MALTTLSAVKTSMEIPLGDTSQDARLSALLAAADAQIKKWLGRNIERDTYTEFLDGLNTKTVRLRETPVTVSGLTAVYYDPTGYAGQGPDAFNASTLMTRGVDYYLDVTEPDGVTSMSGILYRIGSVWPGTVRRDAGRLAAYPDEGRGNIKVVYTGGYATVPAGVTQAANLIVARMAAAGPSGFVATSESFEDRSVSVDFGQAKSFLFTAEVVALLLPYRRLAA